MAFFVYPKVLEADEWDRKKGAIAKLTVETGIGKALTELRAMYGEIEQVKMHVGGYSKPHTHADIDNFLNQAKAYYREKYVPFQARCLAVKKLALDAQAKFKKNKLIPKASEEYVGQVAAAADLLGLSSKNLDEEFASFAAQKVALDKAIATVRQGLKGYMDNLEAAAKECLKEPTGQNWVALVLQKNRSLGNALGNVPELKAKYWGTWQALDGLQVVGTTPPPKVKIECERLLHELEKLKVDIK